MNPEPRREGDYTGRQVQAAHRVLVDIGQVPKTDSVMPFQRCGESQKDVSDFVT